MSYQKAAETNFEQHVLKNPYPGRGLVLGRDPQGDFLIVYWIMGRSENSRNRRFVVDGSTLRTEPVDLAKVEDPSLIIYEAMLELPGLQLVSNGDQTRTLCDALAAGGTFESALATREREPDAPNYTPRITGMLDFRDGAPTLSLAILKQGAFDPARTDRIYYRPALPPAGFGLCLTTYAGDGSPLPSFSGDPLIMPLSGSCEAVLSTYEGALDADNGISVAVKHIDASGRCVRLKVLNRRG